MGHTTMDGMNGIASALDIPPLRRLREAPWSEVPCALSSPKTSSC
jgi:hypothetical protein